MKSDYGSSMDRRQYKPCRTKKKSIEITYACALDIFGKGQNTDNHDHSDNTNHENENTTENDNTNSEDNNDVLQKVKKWMHWGNNNDSDNDTSNSISNTNTNTNDYTHTIVPNNTPAFDVIVVCVREENYAKKKTVTSP